MYRFKPLVLSALLVTLLAGCTDKQADDRRDLTRRERDSIIGESALPGAHGVRGALRASDSAAARQRRAESIR